MVKAVPDILARIIEQKRAGAQAKIPGIEYQAEASLAQRRDFRAALTRGPVNIIAEIKKASPSQGLIAGHFDPPAIARAYERGGAAALSVLTDEKHFQGSLDDLKAARSSVALPALRKDFTVDEYDLFEAAANGADAILLIVAVLDVRQLRNFRERAEQLQMAALVEVHDEDELAIAIDSGASIIGVNNRNLRTFEVSLSVAMRLAEGMPGGAIRVAESGIRSSADIALLKSAGYQGFLVGEHLMRSGNPEQALRDLLS